MDRRSQGRWRGEPSSRSVESSVAQYHAIESSVQELLFEAGDTTRGSCHVRIRRIYIQRAAFIVRFWARRVRKCDALGNHSRNAAGDRRFDQVPRADFPQPSISHKSCRHRFGSTDSRQIGELVDDDVGASVLHPLPESCRIEHVDQNRLDSESLKQLGVDR